MRKEKAHEIMNNNSFRGKDKEENERIQAKRKRAADV